MCVCERACVRVRVSERERVIIQSHNWVAAHAPEVFRGEEKRRKILHSKYFQLDGLESTAIMLTQFKLYPLYLSDIILMSLSTICLVV
jgi:hypothetical protein